MADCPHCKRFFRCADCERNQAEIDLERARQDENRERYAHAEPPRETGS